MDNSIIGTVLGNFEITAVLGKGGMGVVYKAKDLTLDRTVALKMMDPEFSQDEKFLKRFKSEAKALARLHNPNIVSIYSLQETSLGLALIMEFVDGSTLGERIRRKGAMPLPAALHVFRQLLLALDDAHRQGVVHRDIKPGNIMLTAQDVVKVTDFGLAKIQQVAGSTSAFGTSGTLYYMSPEQVRGLSHVDARGDIYAAGMTLYEAVTGGVPFDKGTTDYDLRQIIVNGRIPPPSDSFDKLPKDLVKIIMKAIDKDPEERFQTASEMWGALAKLEDRGAHSEIGPVKPGRSIRKTSGVRQWLLAFAGIVCLLATAYVVLSPKKTEVSLLTISSDPPASTVYVNGKDIGRTPLQNIPVDAGAIVLQISREGYVPKDTTMSVMSGQSRSCAFSLRKAEFLATLSVTSTPPGSTVSVNGRRIGATPTGKVALAAGSAFIRLEQDGFDGKDTTVDIAAGNDVAIAVAMTRLPAPAVAAEAASLVLRVIPNGRVSVDGGKPVELSEGITRMRVAPGERNVRFENPVYGAASMAVQMKPGESRQVFCYFETYVSIGISGDATWGEVYVDGENTNGQAPVEGMPLGPGRHRIAVRKTGYETVEGEQTVDVKPVFERRDVRIAFTLKSK